MFAEIRQSADDIPEAIAETLRGKNHSVNG
jgi:hypothetical protein